MIWLRFDRYEVGRGFVHLWQLPCGLKGYRTFEEAKRYQKET